MLDREYVERVINFNTEKADFASFQAHTAPNFVHEFMGTRPDASEWRGADAVRRQLVSFDEGFTSDFAVTAAEICFDADKRVAVARLQSHPLTDLGGGAYRQHCVWFVYSDERDRVTRVVDYSDTKPVDEMIVRVQTAKMKALE
jgi:ketosteroid isomerase-like protein